MAGLEDTPSTVRTQRPATGLQRVDLEIRFDAPDTVPRRLWLELKWTAPPDRAQRDGYEECVRNGLLSESECAGVYPSP
jgi:hypothetical protein